MSHAFRGVPDALRGVSERVRGPFAGPVKDQSGKVVVAAGKTLSDQELLSMDWYVEGVQGQLPK